MANKYSRYQLKPYVSQYVDPQRVAISGMLRQRYERGLEGHTNLVNAASSQKVGAGDQHIKDNVLSAIQKDFEDITKNNNYEDAGRVLANAQNAYLGNEGLQTAVQSYANWENEQKMASEIKMRTGRDVLFDKEYATDDNGNIMYDENNQPIIVNKFDQHKSYYQDEQTGRMVKNVYQGQGQMMLQYTDQMQKIIENIAGDPIALRKLSKEAGFDNPDDLFGYLVYGQEVSDEKVVKLMKALSNTYINGTAEGKQQMLKLTTGVGMENINPETGNHWDAEQAEAIIQDQMLSIARQQVGADLQYMTDAAYMYQMKNSGQYMSPKLQTFNSDATQNSQVLTALDFISEDDFDVDGKLVTRTTGGGGGADVYKDARGRVIDNKKVAILEHFGYDFTFKGDGSDPQAQANVDAIKQFNEWQRNYFIEKIESGEYKKNTDWFKGAKVNRNSFLTEDGYLRGVSDARYAEMLQAYVDETGIEYDTSSAYNRAEARLEREIMAAKKENRPPRVSILGAHLEVYNNYMRELYPEVSAASKTDKEFFTNMQTIQEKYEVTSTKVYKPTNNYREGFRETILSSPTNWILRREDGSFTNNMTDVQIQLGYKTQKGEWKNDEARDQWEKMITNRQLSPIVGLMTGGQQAGSFAIKLTGEDGKEYTVELGNSNEAQQQFRAPHEIINDLQSGRANDYRTAETAKTIQGGQAMMNNGDIVDVVMKVHYEINTNTMEWEPVVTQYYYVAGTQTEYQEPEQIRRQGTGVIDLLMEQAVSSYMSINHMVGTDMNVGKKTDLSNPAS